MKRGFTVLEFLVIVAIVAIFAALAIPCLSRAKQMTEEEQAAANRARLAKVPIQTEGIKVVELPDPVVPPEIEGTIKRETKVDRKVFVDIQCPCCGKTFKINLKEEWDRP